MTHTPLNPGLHPRNLHRNGYDFARLVHALPALAPYVRRNPAGVATIDFTHPLAVKTLNQALLMADYGLHAWDIPSGYLCPPIPGRVDYVHYLADLLDREGFAGQSASVRMLDIGTGANLIYPLLAHQSYGWQAVGAELDRQAFNHAQQLIVANDLSAQIRVRQQLQPTAIFKGIVLAEDQFTVSMCNPPFHASHADARAGTQRKWRGLGQQPSSKLNFGGQPHELVCEGGEAQFLVQMMRESRHYAKHVLWFTSLVSKAAHLPLVYRTLKQLQARTVHTVDMAQGQKQSRFVAWRF